MKKLFSLFTLILFAAVFSACTHTSETTPAPTAEGLPVEDSMEGDATTSQFNPNAPVEATADPENTFEISAKNFAYSQDEIVVSAGDTVTINLTNTEGTHDFVIDELDVKSGFLSPGDSDSVTFTVGEEHAGETYEFYCSVGNHREMGMVGTIRITE